VDYSALRHCTELRDAHITEAVTSSDEMEALLARFTKIAGPGKGAPVILAALARLGTTACDWIDGELRIELVGDEKQTKIAVSSTIGGGFREKCLRDTLLPVPLVEFSELLARAPRLIEPLAVKDTGSRIILTATQEVRSTSLPPPMVEIDAASLIIVPPLGRPPGVEDRAPEPPTPAPTAAPKIVLRPRVKADGEPSK
jgi:hypothetical protein